jgi:hypothetical protein
MKTVKPLIIPKAKSNHFIPDAGATPGRLYTIADLGTQESTWQGEIKSNRKVMLIFELPEIKHEFDPNKGKEPAVISREFTFSSHEKSALAIFLNSWQIDVTDEFDLGSLLGKEGLINIIHNESNGTTYANIDSVIPLPKGMKVENQYNHSVVFSLVDFDQEIFNKLPEWIRKKITKSPEFKVTIAEEGLPFV